MILGISASARKDGITSAAVKAVLLASEMEYDYVSLTGKRINGCIGCTRCATDNFCKVKDDWNEIGEKMLKAEAIVFGAPNYYGTINALGHACLERTFCFRHRDVFSLKDKLGLVVSAEYSRETGNSVQTFIAKMMQSNKLEIVGSVVAHGYSQCYTCGYGENCSVGNVVKDHGFLDEIKSEHCPPRFDEQKDAIDQAYRAGKLLGFTLRNRVVG
ncbi:multimeric flavodoxin WrbA [Desulfosporosinus acidiphilus SJ4]|uniref:Multimeric flavodoxin WrbA n=1 Tax=Desulfosporosinus acidiphilus (strain DSM 22704 / JCM 16185 / SJ4) TaxID=646529 RepID=I4DAJ7_DESAJ|nr:flavodoxin family protein [Desulfosporosinus acidiphilus]AFM42821.1 multimeric flavodoxin WrbA [Desulfosporosinus acidiphilus SJ4]